MSKFDILLIPEPIQLKKYTELKNALSRKYQTPSFPHLTVLTAVEGEEETLLSEVNKISQDLKKIEVEVLGMNFTNTVYQCVFAQIKATPQLLNLYQELAKQLKYQNESPFFPHLSIVYGDLSPEEKAELANQVKVDKIMVFDKLVVYKYGPLPSDWNKVAEFELK